jgi:serine/threonine protein kinase
MLTKDPTARISAVEVFSHPWVCQVAPPIPDLETLHRIIKKLKSYSHTPTFQKIILYYTTTQVLSYNTIKEASSLFTSLDRDGDGDGYLSSKDLNTCMNDIRTECSNSVCLLKRCSFNNRKYLNYSEFVTIMVNWSEVMTEGMGCTIFNAVSLKKPALSKKKFLIFLNTLPIDEIWTEAFHYLVKPTTDKMTYEDFISFVRKPF